MENTKARATGVRGVIRDAVYILQRAADALRTMCETRRADGARIEAALFPMEAARRGGVLIDGVPCSLWGVYAIDDADMVCDAAQTFEDAWRDFARAFDFPVELSKRLDYVLDSMCDPGGGAFAGTQYAKEGRTGDIYKDFTPENYAENVRQFRVELASVCNPGFVFPLCRGVEVGDLIKEVKAEMKADLEYWASATGRAVLRNALARVVPDYVPPKAGKREIDRLAEDAERHGVAGLILAGRRYGDDFISLLCCVNSACDALERLRGMVASGTAADIRRAFRHGDEWGEARHVLEGEYLKERGFYSGEKFGIDNRLDAAWTRFDGLAFELLDALADRFGSATAAELCGMRQDLRDYLDASDMRSWHIGCEKLAADMIAKERTAAQGVISGIVRRLMVQIERGAAELARTEAATGTQGAKRGGGEGAANVATAAGSDAASVDDRQGVATGPRFPRGNEAKILQRVYILHNARNGKGTNWSVARGVLDRTTLADLDGVPVRMFDDSGVALGYAPQSDDAFRQWVRRAADDEDVAQMAREFAERGRAPVL